jgi:ubiquinone/menaquinone biosynthesis C-methylase UbiE
VDPKRLVRKSYDALAPRYRSWAESVRVRERQHYTQLVVQQLEPGSRVLDLGCGPGGSTTRALAGRFRLTGVDLSWRNLQLARAALPAACFIQSDMTMVQFRAGCFDGVAAFYSLIHVPRDEQSSVVSSIAGWLRPGGLLVLSLGTGNHAADADDNWLGLPMFWSSYDQRTYRQMIERAGFHVVSAEDETDMEFDQPITFHWIVARRQA